MVLSTDSASRCYNDQSQPRKGHMIFHWQGQALASCPVTQRKQTEAPISYKESSGILFSFYLKTVLILIL